MLIVNAQRYPDGSRIDLRVGEGLIEAVGRGLPARAGERVVDAAGGALLPGLHDHHLHLFALAARRNSVSCGPPEVTTPDQLAAALRGHAGRHAGHGWVRGVGYHEAVAGPLDRHRLDAMVAERPVRIEHASGTMWFVNSAGVEALRLPGGGAVDGVECDAAGQPNGRLFRLDGWLRARLGVQGPPDLSAVSAELAACGVTGVTDTTPGNDDAAAALFAAAIEQGALRQRVRLMGSEALTQAPPAAPIVRGELKIILDEYVLPDLPALAERVRCAHAHGRGVAFHCVTRVELVFALRALLDAGAGAGAGIRDRIEHASVTPPDLLPMLRQSGVTVVTQPALVALRGDRYLSEVPEDDHPHLYRLRTFLDHGVPLGLSTDAPYGSPDPWLAMRAAVARRTPSGIVLGPAERLSPESALGGFLTRGDAPGGPPRALVPGAAADLCLLDQPWERARHRLDAASVVLTVTAGAVVYERPPG